MATRLSFNNPIHSMFLHRIPIFAVFLSASAALAENKPLALSEALRQGLRNHPDIIASDSDLQIRLAESLAVTERPNPRLEAEFRALTDKPGVDLKFMQPIRRSYFGMRQNYSVMEQASAKADARARIAGVLNDVFARYVDLWSVQELQDIHRRNREDLLGLREAMEKSVKAGQGNPVDLALLDAEIASEDAERTALDARRLAGSAALSRRIGGKEGFAYTVENPMGIPLPADSAVLERFAVQRTPLRLALMEREKAALARLDVTRADRFGPMEAGVIVEHDGDRGGILLGLGFNMELPVFNKNEAAIAKAEAEVASARNELKQNAPARVAALVKLRHRGALAAESSAARHQEEVLSLFQNALSQARESITKGQAAPNLILPLVSRITEVRMRSFELRVAALEARADLEAALGGRVEEALGASVR